MAKRRMVGNMLGLAVLSTVAAKPMHPYEMATSMRASGAGRDSTIKWGSLYTVVRNLEKHGLLAVAENVRQGGRPERTVYRITDAGRAELADWVRELIAVPERERLRFTAGLSVIGALTPDEVTALLFDRLAALERDNAQQRASLAAAAERVPSVHLLDADYDLTMREAEARWVRSLLAALTDGTMARWRPRETRGSAGGDDVAGGRHGGGTGLPVAEGLPEHSGAHADGEPGD